MGFKALGLGFRSLEFRVHGFRVSDLGFVALGGFWFRVQGSPVGAGRVCSRCLALRLAIVPRIT